MDLFGREESPLTAEEWEALEKSAIESAKEVLVGRRFINVVGPIGAGHQTVSYDVIYGTEPGSCEVKPGHEYEECDPVRVGSRKHVLLPTIFKDFVISWRDLEYFRQFNLPIDTTQAVTAAISTAIAEDMLIFHGNKNMGIEGLLTVEGAGKLSMSDWEVTGNAFNDVMTGISKLTEEGFYGPYYLIMNPKDYILLNRIYHNTSLLEIEQIEKVVKKVFTTPVVPQGKVLLISGGIQNMDIVIAQDMRMAYVESSNMNHKFRIFEILTLRIKRPNSILIIKKGR